MADLVRPVGRPGIVLLTHVMPDKSAMIAALADLFDIRCVVPVPYSADAATLQRLRADGLRIESAGLDRLLDPDFVRDLLTGVPGPVVVCEVGGYFSPVVAELRGRLLGVVEDTEAGHRRYAAQEPLPIPVVSVARSTLKLPEDALIGESVAFSVERLLRARGRTLNNLRVLVLGYGKIGSGCARAFSRRGSHTSVWDISAIRQVKAIADGHRVGGRLAALSDADVVVGATGVASLDATDLPYLPDGCLLVSASSKQVEFGELVGFAQGADGEFSAVPRSGRPPVLLVNNGKPVNFLDNAVVGPALELVQAEVIAAAAAVAGGGLGPGLQYLPETQREEIARLWLERYCPAAVSLPAAAGAAGPDRERPPSRDGAARA